MTLQRYVSASLTHFVGRSQSNARKRYLLLRRILRSGTLKAFPRDRRRRDVLILKKDTDAPLSSNSSCQTSVLCFCDIPLQDMQIHMDKYGPFGVAFSKTFLAEHGAMPVIYVPRKGRPALRPYEQYRRPVSSQAVAFDHLWKRFNRLSEDLQEQAGIDKKLRDSIDALFQFLELQYFPHLKFFDHRLADQDEHNYYLEREWRTTRDVPFSLNEVQRVILPTAFATEFRKDFPSYDGELVFSDAQP